MTTYSSICLFHLGHLQIDSNPKRPKHIVVTYVSFSPDGRELLANMGSEQVYLFDVTRKHAPKYFTIPTMLRKNNKGKC